MAGSAAASEAPAAASTITWDDIFATSYSQSNRGSNPDAKAPETPEEYIEQKGNGDIMGSMMVGMVDVILQRCAGRDMLDDAAAEAQLAEADELLTAAGFVQYLPRRWAKPGCEDKFWQGAAAGMDVLAFGLCACTKLDGMETTNTGDLSVYLAHSADYEQITVSTVPAEKTE